MARRLISTVVRMRGGSTLGFGARARIFDDEALTTLSTIYRRSTGAGQQPNPLLPNAGMMTALTVNAGAGDTTITVAATAGFQVGDIIPIRNTTTFRYRVITNINTGTGVITLDSALGAAFNLTDTMVGAPEMRGHIWGWLETVVDPFAEIEDIASGRRSPPLQVPIGIPAAAVTVQEQGGVLGQFTALNFLGTAILAADVGGGQLNVTVGGDFSDQAFIQIGTNPAASGAIRVPNDAAGWIKSRNAANTGDIGMIRTLSDNSLYIGDAAATAYTFPGGPLSIAGSYVAMGSIPAASGMLRLPASPTISNRNAGNTADEQIWPHLTAQALLGGDVTMTNANQWYDGPSVSLAPGVWLVNACLTINNPGQSSTGARLWNGTTTWASSAQTKPSAGGASDDGSLPLSAIITLAATTTVKASGISSGTLRVIKAALSVNGVGNNASWINAVRIG